MIVGQSDISGLESTAVHIWKVSQCVGGKVAQHIVIVAMMWRILLCGVICSCNMSCVLKIVLGSSNNCEVLGKYIC